MSDDASTNMPVCLTEQAAAVEQRRAALHQERLAAGRLIDPATAEIMWWWAETLDPYGDGGLPPEAQCVGREWFARSPDGDWVSFSDLPEETRAAFRAKREANERLPWPEGLLRLPRAAHPVAEFDHRRLVRRVRDHRDHRRRSARRLAMEPQMSTHQTNEAPVCPVCQARKQKEREEVARLAALRQERVAAGLLIDPATAEVLWEMTQVMDPYGDVEDLPPEQQCVGWVGFARSPGGDAGNWISFHDLPEETVKVLRDKRSLNDDWGAWLDF